MSRAGTLKAIIAEFGQPFVDKVARALGADADPKVVEKAVRTEAKRSGQKPLPKRE